MKASFRLILALCVIGLLSAATEAQDDRPCVPGIPYAEILERPYSVIDYTAFLNQSGIRIESIEDLVAAARQEDNVLARTFSLPALAQQLGQQAIPLLRLSLDDHDRHVREMAADLLVVLRDDASRGRLRGLLRRACEEVTVHKERGTNSETHSEWQYAVRSAYQATASALTLGTSLAKLGEHTCLDLAAQTLLTSSDVPLRTRAIDLLTQVVIRHGTCEAHEKTPAQFVLTAAAESENVSRVLSHLKTSARYIDYVTADSSLYDTLVRREDFPESAMSDDFLEDTPTNKARRGDVRGSEDSLEQLDEYEAQVKAIPPKKIFADTNRVYLGRVTPGDGATRALRVRIPPQLGVTSLRLTPGEERPSLEVEWDHPDATTYMITFTWTPGQDEGHLRVPFKVEAIDGKKAVEDIQVFCYGLLGEKTGK